jgi:hypothetical protein
MPRIPGTSVAAALSALTLVVLAGCGGGHSKPAASPSASATPSATSSPKPVVIATCPLTGLPPGRGQKVGRVALAVKIDNVNDARPQSGLDHADIVWEETVEGGLTRLMAVFQCGSVSKVGPIRSTRTSDGDLLRLLNGSVFGFSGANPRVLPGVAAVSKAVMISYDALPAYFHRDYSRPAPHNVYSSTTTILNAGLARRKNLHAPRPLFSYGRSTFAGQKVHSAAMTWASATAAWTWGNHAWQRSQNGTPDVLTDGKRVNADNVVIMSITTRASGFHDVLGNSSPDDVVTGHGRVWVLRDGHLITGTWSRPKAWNRMVLKGKKGKVIPLHPGRTWIELLPEPRSPRVS